jgi:gliding motility-associated-like protein
MSYRVIILTFLLTAVLSSQLHSQDIIKPEPPVFDYLTVDPSTGFAKLTWISSVSQDVELYVVYTFTNNSGFPIDTLKDKYAVTYTDYLSQSRKKSVSYVIAAMDSSNNISLLSNNLSTIYLDAVNDSCNNRIVLQWNQCLNQRHTVTDYSVLCSINGAAAQSIDTVETLSYSISGYQRDTRYCFYINALSNDGIVSTSNMQCIKTGIENPPGWIDVTDLNVESPGIAVNGSFDTDGDITSFVLEKKKSAPDSWATVANSSGYSGSVSFTDSNADTNAVALYRISAVNRCGNHVTVSGPVRNIVLSATRADNNVNLKWNNPLQGKNSLFSVLRNTGNGYIEIASGITDTIYTDDYSSYAYNVEGTKATYRVRSSANTSHSGTVNELSSAAEINVSEYFMVGNAFTPNGDGLNDTFFPVLAFTPQEYEFTIYSRLGTLLYRSTIPGSGWDGRHNGKLMPPGAYLWTIKIKTPSGLTEKRNGTVAILP